MCEARFDFNSSFAGFSSGNVARIEPGVTCPELPAEDLKGPFDSNSGKIRPEFGRSEKYFSSPILTFLAHLPCLISCERKRERQDIGNCIGICIIATKYAEIAYIPRNCRILRKYVYFAYGRMDVYTSPVNLRSIGRMAAWRGFSVGRIRFSKVSPEVKNLLTRALDRNNFRCSNTNDAQRNHGCNQIRRSIHRARPEIIGCKKDHGIDPAPHTSFTFR